MSVWLSVAWTCAVALAILLVAGWGLARFLAPARLRPLSWPLALFLGLCLIDSISQLAAFLGLTGQAAVLLALAIGGLVDLAALVWRGGGPRRPTRPALALFLCSLPALALAVAPILGAGQLLPIGNSNADPISYASTTDFLQTHTLRAGLVVSAEYPTRVPVDGIIYRTDERLGFEFFQIGVDALTGLRGYATFSIVAAVGLLLWALAAGLLLAMLDAPPGAAAAASLVLGVSALPLWMAYGSYGPQVLGMGLLALAFASWAGALSEASRSEGGWRWLALAALLSAGLAGIYSDALAYLFAPVGCLVASRMVGPLWQARTQRVAVSSGASAGSQSGWRAGAAAAVRPLGLAIGGLALTLAAGPAGWARAIPRAIRIMTHPNAGNVDWMIDLRQVVGLVPFSHDPDIWFGPTLTSLLWVPTVLLLAAAVYGWSRLPRQSRGIAAAFGGPHLISLAWFTLRHDPYGYFKAWSMGWFLYAALIGAALWSLATVAARPHRNLGLALSGALVIALAGASGGLAYSMLSRFACTPALAEAGQWLRQAPPGAPVYVATGDLSTVSVFWLAYFASDRPAHFDVPVIYTPFPGRSYAGEPWVLRDRHATWNPPATATAVAGNADFQLLLVPNSY